MLRSLVRALDRRRRVAIVAAVAVFSLGLLFGPASCSSTASARVVLRPDSPWTPQRAADLLMSDDVLGSAERSLLRVETEPSAVRVATTDGRASTAIGRVNAVTQAFADRAPTLLRAELDAELARLQAAIAGRSAELAGLPAARPDPRVEAEAIRALDAESERLGAALELGDVGPPAPVDTRDSDRVAAEIEAARRRLAELKNTYPDDWPPVVKAAAEIEDLRLRRQQTLNRETLEARFVPVRRAIDRLRELTAERERRAQALAAQPKVAPTPQVRRASLQEHLAKLEERHAKILTERGMADVVLERVEPATGASESRTSLPLRLLIALLAGVVAACVAERLTSTIRTEHDLRQYVNLPVLGVIPLAPDPNDRMVLRAAPDSRLIEPYNTAAALLEGRAAESSAKLIGVTSARAGEGKSTTAANLATSLARGLARVLLVDADLRRPSIHKLFELGDDVQGLSSYLSGAANQLDAVLAATEMENLTVLPAGSPLQNPIPFLRSERLRVVIPELKERFDYVIVDLPPVRSAADALVLAPTLDGIVLVLGAGETGKDDATAAKRLLRDARGKLLGCVLTKAELYSRGYYAYVPSSTSEAA